MAEYIDRKTAMTTPVLPKGYRQYQTDNLDDAYEQGWMDALDNLKNAPSVSAPQWISVKDRLPEVETEVLVACDRNGYRFVCPTIYEDGTVLTQDSIWNWYELENYGTYSEENDDYFVPEGWWENRQFTPDDIYNSPVDCAVTHWMPLPEPPKGEQR